jgi:hypothetical protein
MGTGKKTWRNYRQESKEAIGEFHEVPYRPCDNQIQLGAILRIADAVEGRITQALEKMAIPFVTVVCERNDLQRENVYLVKKVRRLERQIKKGMMDKKPGR